MKHLLSSITVLFILLTSSVSWGSLNGKGLYCKRGGLDYYGVQFIDGNVKHIVLNLRDDKWVWETQLFYTNYYTSTNYISWTDGNIDHKLDRETLILRVYIEKSIFDNKPYERFDQCEVYSPSEWIDFTEQKRKDYQQSYDEQLKDKKI